MLTTTSARLNIKSVGEAVLSIRPGLIILQQFLIVYDDSTRLFGNFYIFSGMYDAGLNNPTQLMPDYQSNLIALVILM